MSDPIHTPHSIGIFLSATDIGVSKPYEPLLVWRAGGYVDLRQSAALRPKPEDLAMGLKRIYRFAGAVNCTVLAHSLAVAELAGAILPGAYLAGLLHDAHEYYTGDVMTPLYRYAPDLRTLGAHVQARIVNGYQVPNGFEVSRAVRLADVQALTFERKYYSVDRTNERPDLWPEAQPVSTQLRGTLDKIYSHMIDGYSAFVYKLHKHLTEDTK